MEFSHTSVLLPECIAALDIKKDGIYVDGTLGGAGHSLEIVKKLDNGRLIGIDRDETALEAAGKRLADHLEKVTLVHGNFRDMNEILDRLGIDKVDGILLDLGVSSPQLDDASRGFSYMADAPLDMRMDAGESLSAYEVINTWSETELRKIFYEYGEERYSPKIAAAIVSRRKKEPIKTTFELVDIIKSAMPAAALREKQHPAKRCFQAIRIAVNDELGGLSQLMDNAADKLVKGGRIAVISFHSLEDRIVKSAFASRERGCTCPPNLPICACGFVQTLKVITRKPITACEEELEANPRARSAKLRVAERV